MAKIAVERPDTNDATFDHIEVKYAEFYPVGSSLGEGIRGESHLCQKDELRLVFYNDGPKNPIRGEQARKVLKQLEAAGLQNIRYHPVVK